MPSIRIAAILAEISLVLCVVAMVLGPIGIVEESVAAGAAGGAAALIGMFFAFRSWRR